MPSRIRVTFCVDNLNIGGTELNAVRTAERLDRSRFALQVVSLQRKGPLLARYQSAGIAVHSFPITSLYGRDAWVQGWRLRGFLRASRTEILHSHDIYSNLFGVFWARMAGARALASRRWWEGLPSPLWRIASRVGHHLASMTLANSERIGEMLREHEGLPSSRISIVRNFVDESAFTPPAPGWHAELRDAWGFRGGEFVIGIVANLHPIKEHASLLRAMATIAPRHPATRLVLVGDGPERERLERLTRELGLAERVVFAGRLSNTPNLHHLFDLSVLCSRSEGLSNSILEAMAAGRPVVATDVGATADAVVEGVTGLLVPSGDPPALVAALERLITDREFAARLGEAGRIRADEHYSAQSALEALEGLYQRLAARGTKGRGADRLPVVLHPQVLQ